MTTETTSPAPSGTSGISATTVAEVTSAVNAAGVVAGVATGNPEIIIMTQAAVALATAIAQIVASNQAPALSATQMQTAWTNMGTSLGAALKAYNSAA